MNLGEFRERTKDLGDDTKLYLSFIDKQGEHYWLDVEMSIDETASTFIVIESDQEEY